ncbi:hypothetical protein CsSME_00010266 [Camellia sinensis var. sinensis]
MKGNANKNANSWLLSNRTEGFMKVYPCLLQITFSHKAGLVPGNTTIRMSFNAKNPFTADGQVRRRQGNKSPGTLKFKSIKLLLHSFKPDSRLKSFLDSTRFRSEKLSRKIRNRGSVKTHRKFGFRPGGHRMGIKRDRRDGSSRRLDSRYGSSRLW